jgi:hypothetical protein
VALDRKMAREARTDLAAAEKAAHAAEAAAVDAQAWAERAEREAKKAVVAERVERAIAAANPDEDEDELEPQFEDLRTRLDDETFEIEFSHLAYEDVVRIVHRDLNLPEPVFTAQDRVRALIWAAQWGHARPDAHTEPPPDPQPSPRPDLAPSG